MVVSFSVLGTIGIREREENLKEVVRDRVPVGQPRGPYENSCKMKQLTSVKGLFRLLLLATAP
jgi:hypothetical protein